jgi:DNA-binding HxlR family transcriptional regulator
MATAQRSYAQNCGLARSLDLLGERWTLLIIRELARGPKRYGDLLAALEGIGTNLLAARLRSLQEAGVVEHVTLPAPAAVAAYALTPHGRTLEPILEDLALWGLPLVDARDPGGRTRAAWVAMAMRRQLERAGTPAPDGLYAFEIGDERFWLRVAGGRSELRDGAAPFTPDALMTAALEPFLRIAAGDRGLDGGDDVQVEGDAARLGELLETFRLPVAG